jgi:hypothetical protein
MSFNHGDNLNVSKNGADQTWKGKSQNFYLVVETMSLLRPLLSATRFVALRSTSTRLYPQSNFLGSTLTSSLPHFRSYASKSKATKSTATLVPGSQQRLTDEAAIEEYEKAEKKMQAAVDWYRKEVAGLETRASGRVTPSLLATVRIELPDSKGELFRLEDVATVGVREGTTLLVTVFEEHVSASTRRLLNVFSR